MGLREVLETGLAAGAYPGAVAVVAHRGVPGPVVAVGDAVRYADAIGTLLPPAERVPAGPDTRYDLASLTKLCTTVVILQLAGSGRLGLDDRLGDWLPATPPAAHRATIRQLLTHTAGYPAGNPAVRAATDPGQASAVIVATSPEAEPGARYRYSDIGPILAGLIAERAAATSLERLVEAGITGPLGMVDTGYRPCPADAVAATEAAERGGCLRGRVHDSTAAALGGVAGHAGLFGTAADLLRFGEALRAGGAGLLDPGAVAEMSRDQLPPGLLGVDYRQGLGARVAAKSFMGPLAAVPVGPAALHGHAFGHTGFTGTSLVIDPARQLTVVLLTNRVHPSRQRVGVDEIRRQVCGYAFAVADTGGE